MWVTCCCIDVHHRTYEVTRDALIFRQVTPYRRPDDYRSHMTCSYIHTHKCRHTHDTLDSWLTAGGSMCVCIKHQAPWPIKKKYDKDLFLLRRGRHFISVSWCSLSWSHCSCYKLLSSSKTCVSYWSRTKVSLVLLYKEEKFQFSIHLFSLQLYALLPSQAGNRVGH